MLSLLDILAGMFSYSAGVGLFLMPFIIAVSLLAAYLENTEYGEWTARRVLAYLVLIVGLLYVFLGLVFSLFGTSERVQYIYSYIPFASVIELPTKMMSNITFDEDGVPRISNTYNRIYEFTTSSGVKPYIAAFVSVASIIISWASIVATVMQIYAFIVQKQWKKSDAESNRT